VSEIIHSGEMYLTRKHLITFISGLFWLSAFSQTVKMPEYNIEAGSILSSGRQTPFWLISNQYGIVSPEKFNGLLGISFRSTESENKRLDYDYELEITDRQTDRNKLYLNQAWLGFKIYFVKLEGGLKEETFGNQDSSLSSGGLLWSGNARPMPKISLKIPDFTPVPYTSGFFEFKGGISHGWFGDNQFVKNAWLHHKYLYIQLGGGLPVHIHYGLHHFAQWGGESKDPEIGRLPDSFRDCL